MFAARGGWAAIIRPVKRGVGDAAPLHAGRGLLQFCGVQRRKALQIILLLFTTLKTTPNPISPERRNAPRSTTIILYSLLFILLPTSNS